MWRRVSTSVLGIGFPFNYPLLLLSYLSFASLGGLNMLLVVWEEKRSQNHRISWDGIVSLGSVSPTPGSTQEHPKNQTLCLRALFKCSLSSSRLPFSCRLDKNSPNVIVCDYESFAEGLRCVEPDGRVLLHRCGELARDGCRTGVQSAGNSRQQGIVVVTWANS